MHVIIQGDAVELSARLIRRILISGLRSAFASDQLHSGSKCGSNATIRPVPMSHESQEASSPDPPRNGVRRRARRNTYATQACERCRVRKQVRV